MPDQNIGGAGIVWPARAEDREGVLREALLLEFDGLLCPACHHRAHDPGSCNGCDRCELHTDEALAFVLRYEPELIARLASEDRSRVEYLASADVMALLRAEVMRRDDPVPLLTLLDLLLVEDRSRVEPSDEAKALRMALDECRQHHADTVAGLDPHTGPEDRSRVEPHDHLHDHLHIGTGPRIDLPPGWSCMGCGQATNHFAAGSLTHPEDGLCERCVAAIREDRSRVEGLDVEWFVGEVVAYYKLFDHHDVWRESGARALGEWLRTRAALAKVEPVHTEGEVPRG